MKWNDVDDEEQYINNATITQLPLCLLTYPYRTVMELGLTP